MKEKRMKMARSIVIATAALAGLGAFGLASAVPAHAETELQALKRQVAEQRALIDKLLAAQRSQDAAIEKMETRTAHVEAQALTPAAAPTPAKPSGILPSGLSWYAVLDANVANTDSGLGRKFTVGSSGMTMSSLGIKADKEMVKGWHAIGELEMGLDVSTGGAGNVIGGTNSTTGNTTIDQGTSASSGGYSNANNLQIFSRQAYAGLGTDDFGSLTLGRQYSGSYIAAAIEGNAFGPGFFGSSALLLPYIGGMPTRMNNSIVYKTPAFPGFLKGLSIWAAYTAGNENNVSGVAKSGAPAYNAITDPAAPVHSLLTDTSGEGYDLAIFYRGPAKSPLQGLTAAVTAWSVANGTIMDTFDGGLGQHIGWQAVASYDFDVVKLYATYVDGWYNGAGLSGTGTTKVALSDADGWSVSAKVPFLRDHAVIASFSQLDDKSTGVSDADVTLWGIAYTYKLFNTSTLYVNYGKQYTGKGTAASLMSLKNGGDMVDTIPAGEAGFNPDGIMIGINTKF
jgi:predicted porin